jgi:hypothetical protein
MLVTSALSVEISKLPPFENSPFPRASNRSHAPSTALPWVHSPIISSIAATISTPEQAPPLDPPAPFPTENGLAAAHDRSQQLAAQDRGCIPPKVREKCSIL